jgi:hypothetical protein
MAKDDYFVIVYSILKYLYECLKKGIKPTEEWISAKKFNIGDDYFIRVIEMMKADGYIEGINVVDDFTGKSMDGYEYAEITPKGIEYLNENSMMKKASVMFGKTVEKAITIAIDAALKANGLG